MKEKLTTFDPAEYLTTDEGIAVFMADAFERRDAAYIAHAVGAVARAWGMNELARKTGLSRELLDQSFSADGSPTLSTMLAVMKAMGVEMTVRGMVPGDTKAAMPDERMHEVLPDAPCRPDGDTQDAGGEENGEHPCPRGGDAQAPGREAEGSVEFRPPDGGEQLTGSQAAGQSVEAAEAARKRRDEERSEAIRDVYKAIERSNQTLREVDDLLFWGAVRFFAKPLIYVVCSLVVAWYLVSKWG